MDTGLWIAYLALGFMAVLPIYLGSHASLKIPKKVASCEHGQPTAHPGKNGEEVASAADDEAEFFSFDDAKWFPIFGSVTLFSLYLVFKFFDREYVNMLLSAYFVILGVGALYKTALAISRAATGLELKGAYRLDLWKHENEIFSARFGKYHIGLLVASIVVGGLYTYSKHWILSNMYGEAFSAQAIQLLNLDSFKTGMALLAGLFFYDIFWVFGTDVMVTVAKSFDAPIKVVWPKDIFENAQFTMLGLGDIVIPGIFIALCLQFDHAQYLKSTAGKKNKFATSFPKPYFLACFIAYILGLITTVVVMHTYKAAQPALLYLSPACILSALLTALVRGETKQLFGFDPNPDSAAAAKKNDDVKGEPKEPKAEKPKAAPAKMHATRAASEEEEKPKTRTSPRKKGGKTA
ncbi:signal peptide peptidase-domain-containing protein [Blyttiomyces helicus]|uniref:Signal peptide peptidase-domain-containing protein n=1 Tax=Blyttiomyces helicus TaxID=388810 RepID=A0A4P9WGA6_9FUNG|nr:signal peptide peptidase-domain-containing protein [Blyttiomyces helicus]|eukprot:RKO91362.1 signal peptide peptidase-domain-containing protein [Blyttiomyces helicus]